MLNPNHTSRVTQFDHFGTIPSGAPFTSRRSLTPNHAYFSHQLRATQHILVGSGLRGGSIGAGDINGLGTSVVERVKRGDQPETYTEALAMARDIRVNLAHGDDRKIREADIKMLRDLDKAEVNKLDSTHNIEPAKSAIESKIQMEDAGLMKPSKFAPVEQSTPEDQLLLKQKLHILEQEGKGLRNVSGELLASTQNRLIVEAKAAEKKAMKSPPPPKPPPPPLLTGRGQEGSISKIQKRRVARMVVDEAKNYADAQGGKSKKFGAKRPFIAWIERNFPSNMDQVSSTAQQLAEKIKNKLGTTLEGLDHVIKERLQQALGENNIEPGLHGGSLVSIGRGIKLLKKKIEKQALKKELAEARGATQAVKQDNAAARREGIVQTAKDILGATNATLDVANRGVELYQKAQSGTGRKKRVVSGRGIKLLKKKIEKQALKKELALAKGATQAVKQDNAAARREGIVQTAKDVLGATNSAMDVADRGVELYQKVQQAGTGKKKRVYKKKK